MNNGKKQRKNMDKFLLAVNNISKVFFLIDDYTGETRLSKIELMTLDYIKIEEVFIMGELATSLRISPSKATGIIDSLVNKKMVSRERNGIDRRVVKIFLTEIGDSLLVSFQKEKRKLLEKMFNILTDKEQEDFTLILEKVSIEFEKKRSFLENENRLKK